MFFIAFDARSGSPEMRAEHPVLSSDHQPAVQYAEIDYQKLNQGDLMADRLILLNNDGEKEINIFIHG